MRPTRVSLSAVGYSTPISLDWYQTPFGVSLAISMSSGGTATASVFYCIDDLSAASGRAVTGVARSGTTITVTGDYGLPSGPNPTSGDGNTHGLSVGDLVQLYGCGILDGWYNVASVLSASSYTLTSGSSGTYTAPGSPMVVSGRMVQHAVLANVTSRTVSNFNLPVSAVQLNVSAYTSGVVTLAVLQGESK